MLTPDERTKYLHMYATAEAVIKAADNPCGIEQTPEGLRCKGHPVAHPANQLCCTGCEHLGPKGCTIKALWCKVWRCSTLRVERALPQLVQIELDAPRSFLLYRAAPKGV